MNRVVPETRPDWVSEDLYPFASRYFAVPPDHRLHYMRSFMGRT